VGEFVRDRLPDWLAYADREGLTLIGKGKWRNLLCLFHDDTNPSMRVNTTTGGWVCMSCGASGGDTLAYHMLAHGLDFIDAAKALGAWQDSNKPTPTRRARTLSARDGLELLYHDAMVLFVMGCDIGKGKTPSDADRASAAAAARRVLVIYEGVNASTTA
jgi:CHC2 zinc finger